MYAFVERIQLPGGAINLQSNSVKWLAGDKIQRENESGLDLKLVVNTAVRVANCGKASDYLAFF